MFLEKYCNYICLAIAVFAAIALSLRLEASHNMYNVENLANGVAKSCKQSKRYFSELNDIFDCYSADGKHELVACTTKLDKNNRPFYACVDENYTLTKHGS